MEQFSAEILSSRKKPIYQLYFFSIFNFFFRMLFLSLAKFNFGSVKNLEQLSELSFRGHPHKWHHENIDVLCLGTGALNHPSHPLNSLSHLQKALNHPVTRSSTSIFFLNRDVICGSPLTLHQFFLFLSLFFSFLNRSVRVLKF